MRRGCASQLRRGLPAQASRGNTGLVTGAAEKHYTVSAMGHDAPNPVQHSTAMAQASPSRFSMNPSNFPDQGRCRENVLMCACRPMAIRAALHASERGRIDIRPNADSNIGHLPQNTSGLKRAKVFQMTVAAASSRGQHFAARKAPHLQLVIRVAGESPRTGDISGQHRLRNLENTMSLIDKALKANKTYAKQYDRKLGEHPTPKVAVVTCMDPRLSDLSGILGLPQADLDVIRTGGPAVTEDVLGELIVSTRVLGTTEIMLLNHTGCGFTTFTDDELNTKLSASTGDASPNPMRFFSYKDPEQNTREQIKKVRSHPWIAKEVSVRGFIFDVETGLIREVHRAAHDAAA
jgi:carbonic anhydrase